MSSSKLSVGIVGLPNVGKSTLFNALLKQQAALAANYPFATIEPNVGVVPVPDQRLEKLAEIVQTHTIKPATVEFVDIAGLVKGAHEGEGLGNKFLSHIREVDLICHVLRDFADESVQREGSVDAQTDRETIETELLLADLDTLEKQKPPRATKDKDLMVRWELVEQFLHAAQQGTLIRQLLSSTEVLESVEPESANQLAAELNLLTSKKILYVINVDEQRLKDHKLIATEWAQRLSVPVQDIVTISAKIESELSSLDEVDQLAYLEDLGISQSGLERLIKTAYQQLHLQSFLTAGEKEVRAWTIHQGMTAPQAAGVIHTDFAKKFIKAQIASYQDFVEYRGWKGVKEQGKMRLEGKEYVMQEGDVVEFKVGA